MKGLKYILTGLVFGVIMAKSEAISWYRIQEMFRFQSFHMYGIIGTAVVSSDVSDNTVVGGIPAKTIRTL